MDNNKKYQKITGLETGYLQLDRTTNGFHNSDLIILASRPGVGKTTFALNLAYNIVSRNDKSVLFFSLEMGGGESNWLRKYFHH